MKKPPDDHGEPKPLADYLKGVTPLRQKQKKVALQPKRRPISAPPATTSANPAKSRVQSSSDWQDFSQNRPAFSAPDPEDDDLPAVDAEAKLFFARPGLQTKLVTQLKQGKIPLEARLDLHGLTRVEAETVLGRFLDDCQARQIRWALIIPGKGKILKSYLNLRLREDRAVLAFSSAVPKHGGRGALYVLIRRLRNPHHHEE